MRISSNGVYRIALQGMLNQQAELSRVQNQVATGKRVLTPADDPIASVHMAELDRAKAELAQFKRNAQAGVARLNTEEQALGDAGLVLQRVRELVISANNGPKTSADREAIAVEIEARAQEMLAIANRTDGEGEYLFSGFAKKTQPFAKVGGSVAYAGDQGVRQLQVAPSQRVADGHSGFDVFMNVKQGNGTFDTLATSTNTGSGVITVGTATNPGAWVPDTYTLTFLTATTYEITNTAPASVTTGTYTSGEAINFNGAQIQVSGEPAVGDTFTIAASQKEDIFTSLDDIVSALRNPTAGAAAGRAQLATALGGSIAQLDQAEERLLNVRAEVGARLNIVESTQEAHESFGLELDRNLSELRDLDYAEAISRLDRHLVGLEAAQKSYATISRLSLFNYL
jgi:flagellar hook-associated protein 3 FlgL